MHYPTEEIGHPVRKPLILLVLLAALPTPEPARAQSQTAVGVGTGIVAGALVGGPVGAVVGGMAGAALGASVQRPRYHVYRPLRQGGYLSMSRRRQLDRQRLAQRYPVVLRYPKATHSESSERPKVNLPAGLETSSARRPDPLRRPKTEPVVAPANLEGERAVSPDNLEVTRPNGFQDPEPGAETAQPVVTAPAENPPWRDPE